MSCNLALVLEIALVTNNDHGEVVLVLDAKDLLLEGCDFLKALAGGDGVDKEETFTGAHVLLSHSGVLFLASGIENVEKSNFIVDNALLAVGV